MDPEISVVPPSKLTASEIDECLAILKEGGAVNIASATVELPLAELVAVRRAGGRIVAVGAIKRQRPWYAGEVSEKSGFTLAADLHELGYVAVTTTQRGNKLSRKITAALLAAFPTRPLFATTSEPRMKTTLANAEFQPSGNGWPGEHGELSLWVLTH